MLYALFGVDDMWGRVVSVLFSILTVYGLYLLVRKFINEQTALWSAFIYAILPLNIFYGRAFMPETAMLMCSVYSIYFFSKWLDEGGRRYFFFSFLFTTFAVLIKLPSIYIGLLLLYLAYQKYRLVLFKNYKLWLLAILILIPPALWYEHAHRLFLNGGVSFGVWTFGQDKWGTFGLLIEPAFYNDVFFKSIAERHLTYAGFILFIWGLFIKRENAKEKLFDVWLIAIIIYILIGAQAHRAQEYYTLPFNIPAAVFIGKVLAKYLPSENLKEAFSKYRFKYYFIFLCLILICILSYLRLANFMRAENRDSQVFKISHDIRQLTSPDDLIITVSNGNTVYLYHCSRRGWTALPQKLNIEYITNLKNDGAKWLTGEKSIFTQENSLENLHSILRNFEIYKDETDYFIVKLK
jgi:4-amino-4-deoxy-L-arabinose transferase-like glycosyltransferase